MNVPTPFRSFFMGGFECAAHRLPGGRRLDLLSATRHDELAEADYRRLQDFGLATVRDGVRWHRIETSPQQYDWSSFLPMLRAARRAGVQVIWDLCHYGWPDGLDIWSAAFVDRFARFAAAVARVARDESDEVPFYCPVNEISFWAWAGGQVGRMNPAARGRGGELKRQLARASIAAVDAIRGVDPRARFVHAEPAIHVTTHSTRRAARLAAERYRLSQYEAYDLLSGRIEPELGGHPDYLDILGLNFYPDNQWLQSGRTIPLGHHSYRPFRHMLAEAYERYGKPLLVAETGAEGSAKPAWLHYVSSEVAAARVQGVPLLGICLYPILDYPGWSNGRLCETGLLGMADKAGAREVCEPVLEELRRQQILLEDSQPPLPPARSERPPLNVVGENG